MLSTDEGKEVGSMRIVPIQKARAHTMSVPLGMNMCGASKCGRSAEPGSSSEHPHSKE